ncbi:MAG: zinc ribbon domain-containing protein [Phycisphaerae bacterium]|nr:zinc ribbon domain-containing protein [Phycisphaerae bacterium]NUQ46901.1 zinc ribbon domain-containing protein [Phycisphaerae bacterium]
MPVFEFQCQACDHAFEELVRSASEASKVVCPECGSKRAARKLSVFAARSGMDGSAKAASSRGPCGRCGDPNGPCAL